MSYILDQAKVEMMRAKQEVQDLRRRHNEAADRFNKAKHRYDRLAARQLDVEIELSRERAAAKANGDYQLAALLVSKPPGAALIAACVAPRFPSALAKSPGREHRGLTPITGELSTRS